MPQVGNNFEYSGRKPLDARQQCDSLADLKANVKDILYPPGFKVFCLLEHKEYTNMAKLNETPVWEENNSSGKAWVRQIEEPLNKDMLWVKEDECVSMIEGQYTVDDLVNMIKAYDKKATAIMEIVTQLQEDVAYIKKNGTVVNPDTDDNIDGALMTDDDCYLITDSGEYLVI